MDGVDRLDVPLPGHRRGGGRGRLPRRRPGHGPGPAERVPVRRAAGPAGDGRPEPAEGRGRGGRRPRRRPGGGHCGGVLRLGRPLPAPLAKVVERLGQKVTVKKLRERDALEWLAGAARARRVSLGAEAAAALVQRFGSDIASLGQALDQLASGEGPITAAEVAARFRNRPDEPMWHYADALGEGDTATAPCGASPTSSPTAIPCNCCPSSKATCGAGPWPSPPPTSAPSPSGWGAARRSTRCRRPGRRGSRTTPELLHRALDALARADLQLKSMPEATHRLTLERLTVALCLWYGGRGARRG